jgi:hypothetical protein
LKCWIRIRIRIHSYAILYGSLKGRNTVKDLAILNFLFCQGLFQKKGKVLTHNYDKIFQELRTNSDIQITRSEIFTAVFQIRIGFNADPDLDPDFFISADSGP